MPELVRLYIRHVAIGLALGVLFTGLLLALNVGNLWHLVSTSDVGLLAVLMLVVFNTIVFAGVQFAFAVMSMGESDRPDGGRRDGVPGRALAAEKGGGDRSKRAGVNFPRA
ncbi:MAG: hypothetical protein JSR87_15260 [Proteobacteria bacterium]|nr:hypothetical protein [Pseudomonadota bacterium]MBS0573514.1 hypothetical protein [Pseudomonadota bacterium]